MQHKLPVERAAITHKFNIAGHEGYITVGMYHDGSPGEIFINMSKEGSAVSGLMDAFARAISYALQYGVPLEVLVDKFAHTRFEPSGFTGNEQIPYAKSITDYIFRWLALKFLSPEKRALAGVLGTEIETSSLEARGSSSEATGTAHRHRCHRQTGIAPERERRREHAGVDPSPVRGCSAVLDLRLDHGEKRQLLQVSQLREHERLLLKTSSPRPR